MLVQDGNDIINPSEFPPTQEMIDIVRGVQNNDMTIVDAVAGSGKEQPVTTLVKTPKGDRYLGDLVVGDFVIGKNGHPTKVLAIYPQGEKEEYKVTFRDGTSTRCGIDHNWSVKSINWRTGYKTLTLREILDHGLKNSAGNCKLQIPLCDPVHYGELGEGQHTIPAYVLGALLGDGSLKSTPAISFHESDEYIRTKVVSKLGIHYGSDFLNTTRNTSELGKQSTLIVSRDNSSNPLKEDLEKLKLCVGSKDRFIPEAYLKAPVGDRLSLLHGLMDTDGSISNNRVSYSTTSPFLAMGVIELVQSLGGTAIQGKMDKRKGTPCFHINVKMTMNPFSLPRKAGKWSLSKKNPPSRYITKIEKTGYKVEQVCITVDAEDSLYLANDFIVTHNTSTCVLVSHNIIVPSLYLAFNKRMATEAATKMPSHVTCKTTHSLAYAVYGKNYQHKLTRPQGRYVNVAGTGSEIGKYFKLPDMQVTDDISFTSSFIGLLIKQTVTRFEQSADSKISHEHLPHYEFELQMQKHKSGLCTAGIKVLEKALDRLRKLVVRNAHTLWDERSDVFSPVLITHDTYLKMYQLSKPVLKYDLIYGDEFQDTSNCVLDIFLNQKGRKGIKLIVVGDKRQAIYGWRGAVNALAKLSGLNCKLTKSFRYGQEVADLAMKCLEDSVQILGNKKIKAKVGLRDKIDRDKPYTMIFRTNAALLQEAVQLVASGKSVGIETDIRDFMRKLDSCVALKQGDIKKVKHEEIIPNVTWEDFETEAEHNPEFKRIMNLVNSGGVFDVINTLKNYKKPPNAHITMSTCHKMKGLERDQVWLAEDFPTPYNKDGELVGLEESEQNLIYVAVTRAIKALEYNTTILQMLEGFVQKSEFIEEEVEDMDEKDIEKGTQRTSTKTDTIGSSITDMASDSFLDKLGHSGDYSEELEEISHTALGDLICQPPKGDIANHQFNAMLEDELGDAFL